MRTLQMILSILSCLFVVAAVVVGSFWRNLYAVLGLMLGALVCGVAMFAVRARTNAREEAEARKRRRDFMDPPEQPAAEPADEKTDK